MIVDGVKHWFAKGGITAVLDNGTAWAARQTVPRLAGSVQFGDSHTADGEITLRRALLVGPHATLVGPGIVYGDALRDTPSKNRWMFGHAARAHPRVVTRALRRESWPRECDLSGPAVVLYHQSANYYMWLVEQLPKLRAVSSEAIVVVPEDLPSFAETALARAGVADRLWRWEGDAALVSQAVVPPVGARRPADVDWLRERVGGADATGSGDERLYISRAEAPRGRAVQNRSTLRSVLAEYDVEVVRPETWSLDEQISRFADAELIIAPHGAGLTNMVWATDAVVIELDNGYKCATYDELADACGHEFRRLQCDSVGNASQPKNSDMRVHEHQLRAALERVNGDIDRLRDQEAPTDGDD